MMVEQKDVFYYITLMNENYAQPDLPAGAEKDLLRGAYRFASLKAPKARGQVTLMGSGAILTEVLKAAQDLVANGVSVDVISVTSWSELARDGVACDEAWLAGASPKPQAFLAELLAATQGPIIAASDYVRAVPESVRAYLPEGRRYLTLGTDGFGRSDTRAALREFFRVDAKHIAQAAHKLLS
jgi:pyruvate dehydrogenase E1 component